MDAASEHVVGRAGWPGSAGRAGLPDCNYRGPVLRDCNRVLVLQSIGRVSSVTIIPPLHRRYTVVTLRKPLLFLILYIKCNDGTILSTITIYKYNTITSCYTGDTTRTVTLYRYIVT